MKSKLLPLLILSLALLGLGNLNAQETSAPATPPPESLTKYGFEVGKLYLGEVADLYLDEALAAARPLIEDEIARAWNDGYKQGVLDYGPESAKWEATAYVWRNEAVKTATGPTWGTVAIAGGGGLIIGAGIGVVSAAVLIAAAR